MYMSRHNPYFTLLWLERDAQILMEKKNSNRIFFFKKKINSKSVYASVLEHPNTKKEKLINKRWRAHGN